MQTNIISDYRMNSDHLVDLHFQRLGKAAGIDVWCAVSDQINDIRRYLSQLGLYYSTREWPSFIEQYCDVEPDGTLSLNRKKLLTSKELSDHAAAKILGDELLQKDPELLKKLDKFFKGRGKSPLERLFN